MTQGLHQLFPEDESAGVLSVAELYDEVQGALSRAFPRERALWVRGEIQKVTDHRSGHCYIELVDHDHVGSRAPCLNVKCWKSTWGPLRARLRAAGIELQTGAVVTLRGQLDVYPPQGSMGFIVQELDVDALIGAAAAKRAALLEALRREGLLEANRQLAVPPVALRIGLVASPGTEGYRDFVGQLERSDLAFAVRLARAAVQGAEAPTQIARALEALVQSECDLVVLVRGGGSKADLAAFDSEPVARAIATSPLPVWTGIGHTGDQSVADLVANRSWITPTECGRELAQRVAAWWEGSVSEPADALARRAVAVLVNGEERAGTARARLAGGARHLVSLQEQRLRGAVGMLSGSARHRLGHETQLLAARAGSVARCAPRRLATADGAITRRSARIGPLVLAHLRRAEDRNRHCRQLLAAYDPERQLERGYTMTFGPDGVLVRSAAALVEGDELTSRFADGTVRSTVSTSPTGVPAGTPPGDGDDLEQED